MRTQTRQKLVDYTVYIAKDGKEFGTESACLDHEKRLSGERIECPSCGGRGYFDHGMHQVRNEMTCQYEWVSDTETCPRCHGKGYLDKKVSVTWN